VLKVGINVLQLKVIISVPPIPSNGTLRYIWLQTVTVILREHYLVSVTNQLANVFARKATRGSDVIGVWQVTTVTLTAGRATAVRLAVLLPYVMLQGSVLACTTLLDEHVTSAALVTTSILSVCVSITCAQISATPEKSFLFCVNRFTSVKSFIYCVLVCFLRIVSKMNALFVKYVLWREI
jgi:hypothetical protein